MNKNQYRIVFNRARNIKMIVAESVKSQSAGSSVSSSTHLHRSKDKAQWQTLKPLAFSVMMALGLVTLVPNSITVNNAHAEIVADTAAPAAQRPIVTQAANGVPLVNIQTPTAAGVSRNTYSQFDVNSNGVILNNSRTVTGTQLGGFVQGNPYMAAGTARVILNEVNSQNPSYLNGFIEVAGSRAQVIVANPAGISCNGCGFINTSRATLTTGAPIVSGGSLIGYRVGGGAIDFTGAGIESSSANFTDLIARAVNVNAGIYAQNLNLITGTNQVNVASNGAITSIAGIAPDASLPDGSANNAPSFAVDVAALGGMYAGKIHLVGTEAGLGVSNAGNIGASAGEVRIDINGNLVNSDASITAQQDIHIHAAGLTGDGKVLAGGDANVNLTSDYTHTSTGELQADGDLNLTSTGNITNQAKLLAGNAVTINAANINNAATGEIAGADTTITTTDTLTNRGLINGGDTFINSHTVNNIGTGTIYGDHIAIASHTLNNQDEAGTAAAIAARTRLDIAANTISNVNESLLFSAGDMGIGATLDANTQATGQAARLTNQGATIEALGALTANVADLQNLNAGITTEQRVDSTRLIQEVQPEAWSRRYDISRFPTIFNYRIEAQAFTNEAGAVIRRFEDYTYFRYTETVTNTYVLTSNPGQLLSSGNMTLIGNVTNSDSRVIAGDTLSITGGTLTNLNTAGSTITSYRGYSQFRDWDGNDEELEFGAHRAFNPATRVNTYQLSTTEVEQNTTPAGTGTTVEPAATNTLPTKESRGQPA